MPGPLLLPLIGAGANLLGQGINALSQGSQNQKNRDFAEHMYDRQRSDALADMAFQNFYNSPAEQMKRLQAAGLNPHLVYGNGATQNAAPVRSSSAATPEGKAVQFDPSQALMVMYDLMKQQAVTNQTLAATKVLEEERLLKIAQTQDTWSSVSVKDKVIRKADLDYNTADRLQPFILQQAEANLRKTQADTEFTLAANERAAALQAPNLEKAIQEVVNMRTENMLKQTMNEKGRAEIEKTKKEIEEMQIRMNNMLKSGRIMDYDIGLRSRGIDPGDPGYLRIVKTILDKITGGHQGENSEDYKKFKRDVLKIP